ncbi:MAG: tRNA (adenosine(37)-N6)-threonylcarbamoyltransferase complex ATPase subunit type 1 TsaE [Nannocystis sp.]|uniref:tRNA (adenosine(37)-N6)-threonylcarbamoyltransferase complex ATPase subunit type 1 TsaE n=1 Tax=Nannocystis sp. TaxID=1962667 RepID=UPI00242A0368|nr:tRNA (adenosine(37)-N6)-threonylcarbamoyltransferase complex ATPase subunit type 1 TsaE [Nannocystis sp.]MBK9755614.1 tRNA (adenosine(37)-N6)-threonylcarbamoyltransferase complex ATPase subunit type 1 TsaE [Nannocystis sp.]
MSSALLDEVALKERARALGALLRASAEGLVGDEFAAVLLLDGPMGAGKTTFTRALAAGLGVAHAERVCSPTFTLCMVHAGAGPGPVTLIHVDLFRLADADDEGMGGVAGFDALDLEEIAGEATSGSAAAEPRVLVVEWAAKWSAPPPDHLAIRLAFPGGADGFDDSRRIVAVEARGARSAAILARWSDPRATTPLL